MSRRLRWSLLGWSLLGSVVLVTLAGCGKGFMPYAEREPWRREAEVACLNSGTVARGEGSAYGYSEEPVRPPGAIPGGSRAAEPRWPIQQQPYGAPQPYSQRPYPPPSPQPYPPPVASGEPMSIHAPGTAPASAAPDVYPQHQLGAPPG